MPRENKRLKEALDRVDNATIGAKEELNAAVCAREIANQRLALASARVDTLIETRSFLTEGGKA